MMWRFAVAAALLVLLVVLVADMLFGNSPYLGIVDRYPPPPRWYGDDRDPGLSGAAPPSPASRFATASGQGQLAEPTGAVTEPDAGRDMTVRSDVLPAGQADMRGDEPWPGPGLLTPLPASEVQPQPVNEPGAAGRQPAESAHRSPVPAAAAPVSRAQVIDVQRQLTELGYKPGLADGRMGQRTIAAVRDFQRDIRKPQTGRIDANLLAQLETQQRMRTHLRQQELEALSPAEPKPEPRPERGIFGTILGGVQRLMGRNFDSVSRPEEINIYCRNNSDTWIYDFGREAFLYCGNVRAGQTASANADASQ